MNKLGLLEVVADFAVAAKIQSFFLVLGAHTQPRKRVHGLQDDNRRDATVDNRERNRRELHERRARWTSP